MKFIKISVFGIFVAFILFLLIPSLRAQTCSSADDCKKLISEYEQRLSSLGEQHRTLSTQIQYMDTQIYLTTLQIQQTEKQIVTTQNEIENLTGKIEGLNTSLDYLSKLLLKKIAESYKRREVPFFDIFVDSENASVLANRLKYARVAQENDRKVAFQVQQAKLNFEEQKTLREQKKLELDQLQNKLVVQKNDLDVQKSAKQKLLAQTQNDELRYQNLLANARAEQAQIQGIISGAGSETKLRDVSKGETIASIISGASCNSTGGHLHFTVQIGGGTADPFNYLKPVDHSDDSGGDSWHPSGSWDWPISTPISFNQGYGGDTWFIRTYHAYSFHNGIDIYNGNLSVHSVADGTLYRGSYSGNGGCALPYAKVQHKDGGIITLYLHTYVQ